MSEKLAASEIDERFDEGGDEGAVEADGQDATNLHRFGAGGPERRGLGSILKADGTIAAGGAGKSYDSGRALLDTARG